MTIVVRGLALLALFAYAPAVAQERQHDQYQGQKEAGSLKPATTKCCEGMDKLGEMKAKIEKMTEMKEKMAEKMGEKGMKIQTPESKVEKAQSTKDAHQHE